MASQKKKKKKNFIEGGSELFCSTIQAEYCTGMPDPPPGRRSETEENSILGRATLYPIWSAQAASLDNNVELRLLFKSR